MLSDINCLDISQDEIALKDIDDISQDFENLQNKDKKPMIPLLDFSKLKGGQSQ